jgi:hypothetical protein
MGDGPPSAAPAKQGQGAKNRQAATLPLRTETAADLRAFLADKLPTARTFAMPRIDKLASMFRADLADAGIPYIDDAGRVADFHALRVTFVTLLAAEGVPVRTLQSLARHSTPELTMNAYARTLHGSEADAINRLPVFSGPSRDSLRATGTDSATPDGAGTRVKTGGHTGGNAGQISASACPAVHTNSNEGDTSQRSKSLENTRHLGEERETRQSHRADSNRRPAVYKDVTSGFFMRFSKGIPRFSGCWGQRYAR